MSRARPPQQNERLLHALTEGGVTFVVIGGVLESFEALRTIDMVVYGITAKVLARDDLIRVKRTVARPKDIAVALELEAAREREAQR